MRLEYSPAADVDLVEIASFIARRVVPWTLPFVDELAATCTRLVNFTGSGRARFDLCAGL